jgi:alpha-glucosidase (family GH31 glycosyl hydrolase)
VAIRQLARGQPRWHRAHPRRRRRPLPDDGWFVEREPGSLDLYVFCYGHDYRAALAALHTIAGAQPLVPRWALGNWWSRYHPYSDAEYLRLLDRFAEQRLPFSVAVIDMDWHVTDVEPTLGSGWTGFTWNPDLFADPPAFLAEVHRRGLRTSLNLHPADGIRAHEQVYPQMAEAMGVDPASRLPVSFDFTDPRFVRAYFELVLHPLEAQGVDLWWLDWQQGSASRVPGLDPLWLLNHLHFLDSGRATSRPSHSSASRPSHSLARPLTFSRYAGLGSHRYPIGFSGDTVVSWASLQFQPELTATAANVGYGWWSHDIGGHMFGVKDDELATRWVQLGVFSPILRLHSTLDDFNSKEPWRFREPYQTVMGDYLRLRHQLLPYLATMAYRSHHDGCSLVEPMYYDFPDDQAAYEVPGQFTFGSALMVAPVTTPVDRCTLRAPVRVWLPPGDWVDLSTGLTYTGGRTITMHRDIATLPVLARPGTVLPLVPETAVGNDTGVPSALQLWIVAGHDGTFELVEDTDDDAWAFTTLRYRETTGTLTVAPTRGALATAPVQRGYSLVLIGFGTPEQVELAGVPVVTRPGPAPGSVIVDLGSHGRDGLSVTVSRREPGLARHDVDAAVYRLLDEAQAAFAAKARLWHVVRSGPTPAAAALAVRSVEAPTALLDAVTEILLARA